MLCDSAYWSAQMAKYDKLKEELDTKKTNVKDVYDKTVLIISQIDGVVPTLDTVSGYMEFIKLTGKPFDDGKLKEASTSLTTYKDNFVELKDEAYEFYEEYCNQHETACDNYDDAEYNYNIAYAAEQAAKTK